MSKRQWIAQAVTFWDFLIRNLRFKLAKEKKKLFIPLGLCGDGTKKALAKISENHDDILEKSFAGE